MLQKLFQIPGTSITIYSYGLMLVIGFFAGASLMKFLARKKGCNPEHFMNAALLGLVAGIVGARLSHILENWHEFHGMGLWKDLAAMVNVTQGGLTYYGGFLLAFPVLVIYARLKKIPLGVGMDIVAPALLLAYGFGRIGCLLNGCCYGADCSLPWAVHYPYGSIPYVEQFEKGDLRTSPPPELLMQTKSGVEPLPPEQAAKDLDLRLLASRQHSNFVHPTQLYSSFTEFLLAALLLCYFTLPHVPGHVFALMCIFEGITRFLLEMLRVEPPVLWGWSLSMLIGVVVFVIGVGLWILFSWLDRRQGSPRDPAIPSAGNTAATPAAN